MANLPRMATPLPSTGQPNPPQPVAPLPGVGAPPKGAPLGNVLTGATALGRVMANPRLRRYFGERGTRGGPRSVWRAPAAE